MTGNLGHYNLESCIWKFQIIAYNESGLKGLEGDALKAAPNYRLYTSIISRDGCTLRKSEVSIAFFHVCFAKLLNRIGKWDDNCDAHPTSFVSNLQVA